MSKTRQYPQHRRTQKVHTGQHEGTSDFHTVQISRKMNLHSHSWNCRGFLQISICCPASSSGQAACNSKSTIVILSRFRNMQFEIRAGGGRKGLAEAKTQIQIVPSANLILNPYLVVPITAPQTSVSATGSKSKHISSVLQMFLVADPFRAKAPVLCWAESSTPRR